MRASFGMGRMFFLSLRRHLQLFQLANQD